MTTEPYRVDYQPGYIGGWPAYRVLNSTGQVVEAYIASPYEAGALTTARNKAHARAKELMQADLDAEASKLKQAHLDAQTTLVNRGEPEPAHDFLEYISQMQDGDVVTITRDQDGRFIIVTVNHKTGNVGIGNGQTLNQAWEREA